jgi:pyridoxamine 5'-phosphate oxidase
MPKSLDRADLSSDPIEQFRRWFDEAVKASDREAAIAMCLSTVDARGMPEGRIVLMKDFDDRGFVFYTNTLSPKGRALDKKPQAALTFYWPALERQVRIQGTATRVGAAEADAYFQSRPRGSQVGAWASQQSEALLERKTLDERVAQFTKKFEGGAVPRPPHWTGYRIAPVMIEFWQGRASRLHDRFVYRREGTAWTIARLYP